MIGQTLGHYRIVAKLGQGGMGVVYEATDTHLGRRVAIKVLPPGLGVTPERRRRFAQEAKAASALNHPNIVTIYDIDTADGVDFIAMEFVAGHDLAELIRRRALRLSEALRYGVEIASALAKAHAAGIVHRDLKPSNVMVTPDGLVKVLDFGLAKLTTPEDAGDGESTRTDLGGTEEGAILGTPAYMSPEQAEGKPVDARSDIFSFGSMLYEMITGRPAFSGQTRISTWSAILNQQPASLREVVPGVPPLVEKVISLCLEKDPARRLQHIGDAKILLEQAPAEPAAPAAASAPRRQVSAAAVVAGVILIAGVGGTAWRLRSRPAAPAPAPSLTRLTADSGLTTDPALSRDGKLLVYASDRSGEGHLDLWLQQVTGGQPVRLTTDQADDHQPSFSHDGSQVVFRSEREEGGVYVAPTLGGEPRLVARNGRNPRFSPDGKWIAYWTGGPHYLGRVYVVAASGGPPKEIQLPAPPAFGAYPVWSPDSKHLLFVGADGPQSGHEWWVASAEDAALVRTGALASFGRQGLQPSRTTIPHDWVGDRVLFSAALGGSTGLWEARLSSGTWQVRGPAQRLTLGTGIDTAGALSASGRTVFASLEQNIDLWSLPIDPNRAVPSGELRRLTDAAAADMYPSITADGKVILFRSIRAGDGDLWLKDLETGRERVFVASDANETYPLLSADGLGLVYEKMESQITSGSAYRVSIGAGGRAGLPERVCDDCGIISDVSRDGKILFHYYDFPQRLLAWTDVASGNITGRLEHPNLSLADPRASPDNAWVAFHTFRPESLRRQMFVSPLRATPPDEWIPITDGSTMDRFPTWSPDGAVLYFISERDGFRCLAAQRLDPATKKPAGPMFYVQHLHQARRSMMNFPNPNYSRPAIAADKIVFPLAERTGNIWMLELER